MGQQNGLVGVGPTYVDAHMHTQRPKWEMEGGRHKTGAPAPGKRNASLVLGLITEMHAGCS